MTIERGREWGAPGVLPPNVVVAASDRDAAAAVRDAVVSGAPPPVVRVVGGDLWATLGRPVHSADDPPGVAVRLLPVDALVVTLDDLPPLVAVAHVVLRRSWWFGPVTAVMNAQFHGTFDVAPRSHPNDGRADVVEADGLPLRQRIEARRRLPTGTHVPHPNLRERRVAELHVDLGGRSVWLDGTRAGRARTLVVRVVPDAFLVAV